MIPGCGTEAILATGTNLDRIICTDAGDAAGRQTVGPGWAVACVA